MLTVKCVQKARDKRGNIVCYGLVDKQGQLKYLTGDEIKNLIRSGKLAVIDLKIDKAGRLIDKSLAEKAVKAGRPEWITPEDISKARYMMECQKQNHGESVSYEGFMGSMEVEGSTIEIDKTYMPRYTKIGTTIHRNLDSHKAMEQIFRYLGYDLWYYNFEGSGRYLITRHGDKKKALEFSKEALDFAVGIWLDIYEGLDKDSGLKIRMDKNAKNYNLSVENYLKALGKQNLCNLYSSDSWDADYEFNVYKYKDL